MASKRNQLGASLDGLIVGTDRKSDKQEVSIPKEFTGKKVTTSVSIDEGLRNQLRHYCIDNGTTLSNLVEEILIEFWEKNIKDK